MAAAKPAPAMPAEIPGFMADMSAAGEWTAVPVLVTGTEPGGPADAGFVSDTLATMRAMLEAAMPAAVFPIVLVQLFGRDLETAVRVVLSTSIAGVVLIPVWLAIGKWWLGL